MSFGFDLKEPVSFHRGKSSRMNHFSIKTLSQKAGLGRSVSLDHCVSRIGFFQRLDFQGANPTDSENLCVHRETW